MSTSSNLPVFTVVIKSSAFADAFEYNLPSNAELECEQDHEYFLNKLPFATWISSGLSPFVTSVFQLMTSITLDIGSPRSVVTFVTVDNRLPSVFVRLILLQHGYCTLVIILFGPFARLFINLTMCIRALFPKSATTLGLVEQAFWTVPLFTE